ncbi:oligosaccharide flippase family protein [Halorussus marinus]|uniref:oligosaccharide flippase family protein n=1 Tax=Halorussus marinus TaxID=2505976 RepID=UPI001091FDE5|nr:oligosaccharide flippase family protein [Halorussus marinus]
MKDKIISDVIVSTVVKIAQKGRGIFFIPIITFYLGTSAYGAYAQLLVVTNLFAGIFGLGLHAGLIRYFQRCTDKKEKCIIYFDVLAFVALIGFAISAILYFYSSQISTLTLGDTEYTAMYQMGSVLVPLSILNRIVKNYYKSSRFLKLYSIIDGLKTYVTIGMVSYIVVIMSGSLSDVVTAIIGIEICFFLILQADVIRRIGITVPKFQTIPGIFDYSALFMISQVSSGFLSRADRLLIGYFLGPTAVGVYTTAYKVSNLILLFALPLNNSFFPEFSNLWEDGESQRAIQYLNSGVRYFLTLCVPSILGFLLVGESLLRLIAPESIAVQAANLLPALGIGIALWSLIRLYSSLFFAAESPKRIASIRFSGAVINVILNAILIPILGLFGAVITTVVSYLLVLSVILLWSRSKLGIHSHFPGVNKIGTAAILMYILARQLWIENIWFTILSSAVLYFIILYGIGGVSRDEITLIIRSLRDIISS